VGTALLVDYFNELPQLGPDDDPAQWKIRLQAANEGFKKRVQQRYVEGTLQRLLQSSTDSRTRRASILALGLMGTMNSNRILAACLHEEEDDLRRLAVNALWSLWFRGDSEENARELQRLVRTRNLEKAAAGLNSLVMRAPRFAEAYNQRAILYFRTKQYERSIADCQKVLKLNPLHFGALSGMAQCLMQLDRHKAALKVFRSALRIHPHLEGVADTVRELERSLENEER
jgi:tetratricopeptide (TPR) repeat protein